jgi:hypothetical protein
MRKIIALFFTLWVSGLLFAQDITVPKKKVDVSGRAGDHFMMQLSSDRWMGAPDSINSRKKTTSRGANIYLMLDKPFKGNPNLSLAFGLGVGTSHLLLNKMSADISGTSSSLKFNNLDTLTRFSKYKLSTAYAEIPIELRYYSNPQNPNKSVKAAIGIKIGTLINAHTKGKTLQDASGKTLQEYTQKLNSKNYFNTTRLVATARFGYGCFSIFGAYNLTAVFKDKVAAKMNLLQTGITISGL